MVGRRVSPEVTFDDSLSYFASVKEAFHDEPAKYDEFINLLNDFSAHRVDVASTIARVEELMKDHQKLLLGFNVFLPAEANRTIISEANRTIPLEAKTTFPPEAKRIIVPKAKRTIPLEAKTTFPPEAKRIIVPKAKRTIPPEAKRTIVPKAEQHAEPSYTKRKRAESDGADFMKKLKTRFQSIDTHVVESFQEIMQMWKEGKKSVKKVHEEVVDLLYYHEDLIEDFSRFLPKE